MVLSSIQLTQVRTNRILDTLAIIETSHVNVPHACNFTSAASVASFCPRCSAHFSCLLIWDFSADVSHVHVPCFVQNHLSRLTATSVLFCGVCLMSVSNTLKLLVSHAEYCFFLDVLSAHILSYSLFDCS